MESATQQGPLAVITGASSGIGFELANVLAENGFDLLVAAEDAELMDAQEALKGHGVSVQAHRVDLATEAGVVELFSQIGGDGRPVEVLALNAGVGASGAFATETSLEDELRLVDLNVRSTMHLCKLVLPDMVERDAGRVLFTSSVAATMPGPFQAVYNASKSFVQSLALALRNELKDSGVTVTALMPGPTDTEFFERAEMQDTKIGAGRKDDPATVARQGFEALMADEQRIVAGSLGNKAQAAASRAMPDWAKAELHRRMAEPGSAKED